MGRDDPGHQGGQEPAVAPRAYGQQDAGGGAPADHGQAVGRRAEPAGPRLDRFAPLFTPRTIAVIGASATEVTIANTFIRRMKAFGYAGSIWPIHPSASEVEGLPAFRSLADTPGAVDYAYVAIGATRVAEALAEKPDLFGVEAWLRNDFREGGGVLSVVHGSCPISI